MGGWKKGGGRWGQVKQITGTQRTVLWFQHMARQRHIDRPSPQSRPRWPLEGAWYPRLWRPINVP